MSIVFARPLGTFFSNLIGVSNHLIGTIIAFVIIFFCCGALGFLGAWLLHRMIRLANLGFLDRLMGGILGILQGSAIAGVILIVLYLIPTSNEWIENSLLAKQIVNITVSATSALPEDWKDYLAPQRWIGNSHVSMQENLHQEPDNNSQNNSDQQNS